MYLAHISSNALSQKHRKQEGHTPPPPTQLFIDPENVMVAHGGLYPFKFIKLASHAHALYLKTGGMPPPNCFTSENVMVAPGRLYPLSLSS